MDEPTQFAENFNQKIKLKLSNDDEEDLGDDDDFSTLKEARQSRLRR